MRNCHPYTVALGVPLLAAVAAFVAEKYKKSNEYQKLTIWLPNQASRAELIKNLDKQGLTVLPLLRLLRVEEASPELAPYNVVNNLALALSGSLAAGEAANWITTGPLIALFEQLMLQTGSPDADIPAPLARSLERLTTHLTRHQVVSPAMATRQVLQAAARQVGGGTHLVVGVLEAHGAALELLKAIAASGGTFVWPALPVVPTPDLPSHPGAALAKLLAALHLKPEDLAFLPGSAEAPAPAAPTLIACPHPASEAATLRLLVQQAMAEHRTPVHVLCPDNALQDLLAAELSAHGLTVRSPSLDHTPAGQLMLSLLSALAAPRAPALSTLSAALTLSPWLDVALWRGVAATRWEEWQLKLRGLDHDTLPREQRPFVETDFARLREALEPLAEKKQRLAAWADSTLALLETLQPTWLTLPGGLTLRRWLEDARQTPGDTPCTATLWATRAAELLPPTCLPKITNPDVLLTGLLEARLLEAGTVVIAGANEGTWPATDSDLLLGDEMCERLGLPGPRQRLRLTAAEWHLALHAAPRVFITRSSEDSQGPTRPSRFLLNAPHVEAPEYAQWAETLPVMPSDGTLGCFTLPTSLAQPAWSASWVEDLAACPYRAVGKRRLRLKESEPYMADPTAEAHGLWVHEWLAAFWRQHTPPLEQAAATTALLRLGEQILARQPRLVARLWRSRLPALSEALVSHWLEIENQGRRIAAVETDFSAEVSGTTLKARADRVDDGPAGAWLVDYKTGGIPTWKAVMRGEKPQLLVETFLAVQAGRKVAGVEYVQVKGHGNPLLEAKPQPLPKLGDAVARTGPWLAQLVDRYRAGKTFPAVPVYGGGLEPKGHCKYCPLGGVCRWPEALPETISETIPEATT